MRAASSKGASTSRVRAGDPSGGHAARAVRGKRGTVPGLAIHGKWDWSTRHPVVPISFGGRNFVVPDRVREDAESQLAAMERRAGFAPGPAGAADRFGELIEALHERAGQRAVVLVDEYDKPILDALSKPETARANRDFLRGFYAMIKDCDRHLRFVSLTCMDAPVDASNF